MMFRFYLNCMFFISVKLVFSIDNTYDNGTRNLIDKNYLFLKEVRSLENRIKSLEQPSWDVTKWTKRWLSCSKGPCRCSLETKTVSCWRKNLEYIPRKQIVPYDTNTLDLSINSISAVNKEIFNGLQRLIELDMSYNRLDYLPEPIFQSLNSLQHLKLRNNMIEQLHKDIFKKQSLLENLDLSFNRLYFLDPDLLRGTPRLVALSLAHNGLQDLPAALLQDLTCLQELDLSGNRLRTLPPLGLMSLRNIDLTANSIYFLPSDVFKDTPNLEVITASRNYLTHLKPNSLRNLTKLTFVDLTSNRITEIIEDEYPANLRELHLGQNRIRELPPLQDLKRLERLYLFSNQITRLRDGVFRGTSSLKTLFLNNNDIKNIEPEVFRPLRNLQYLQLGGNCLLQLPGKVFSDNPNLAAVKLTKNSWHCDCSIRDFAKWLKDNKEKVWDMEPTCLGPGELGGRPIDEITEEELCDNPVEESQGFLVIQRPQKNSKA